MLEPTSQQHLDTALEDMARASKVLVALVEDEDSSVNRAQHTLIHILPFSTAPHKPAITASRVCLGVPGCACECMCASAAADLGCVPQCTYPRLSTSCRRSWKRCGLCAAACDRLHTGYRRSLP